MSLLDVLYDAEIFGLSQDRIELSFVFHKVNTEIWASGPEDQSIAVRRDYGISHSAEDLCT